jgi:hypothetical protein
MFLQILNVPFEGIILILAGKRELSIQDIL